MRRRTGEILRNNIDLREWPATGTRYATDPWFDDRAQQLSFTFVQALSVSGGVVFNAVTDVDGRDVILRGRARPDLARGTVVPPGQADVQMKSVRSVLKPPATLPSHVPGRPRAYLRYPLRRTDYERLRLTPAGSVTTPYLLFVVQLPADARLWCIPPRHGSAARWSKIGARGWWLSLKDYPAPPGTGDYVPVFLPRRQSLTVRELQRLVDL